MGSAVILFGSLAILLSETGTLLEQVPVSGVLHDPVPDIGIPAMALGPGVFGSFKAVHISILGRVLASLFLFKDLDSRVPFFEEARIQSPHVLACGKILYRIPDNAPPLTSFLFLVETANSARACLHSLHLLNQFIHTEFSMAKAAFWIKAVLLSTMDRGSSAFGVFASFFACHESYLSTKGG